MTEFFKAELKDKFLSYACSRDDYFESELLYDEFLRPHYDQNMVEKLIQEILEHDPNLLDTISGNGVKIFMISSTPYTEEFLENSGFKNLYVQEEEKWDTFLHYLGADRPISSNGSSGKTTKKRSLRNEKRIIIGMLSALAFSFLTSLVLLLRLLFGSSYVPESEHEERMTRMEVLHREEINSIQRELRAIRAHQLNQNQKQRDSL